MIKFQCLTSSPNKDVPVCHCRVIILLPRIAIGMAGEGRRDDCYGPVHLSVQTPLGERRCRGGAVLQRARR